MTAVRFHNYGDTTQLRVEPAPRPAPMNGQVRVRVRAASVNPYDWKFRDGRLRAYVPAQLPFTPAAKAQDLSKQGGTPGKIILAVD